MKPAVVLATIAILLGAPALEAGTKLSRAVVDGNLQLAKNLVETGEKVNDVDKWGWTPLAWAAYYGHPVIVKWLLEQGADPNILTFKEYGRYKPGVSPLLLAAYYGYEEIVADLLKAKADPDIADVSGRKPVDYARDFGFTRCVELLSR
ncbi:ankyrin repeat domain-containing protein [Geothrix sp. 21YS21S-2]|uniref:ankyrin repeat domain-containing protein n=1 Tax=Geothrix sp. 21YS21S-2 TaxID=3068893 RepID=UPI0027B9A42D|nr:ankyrin repeat domain-containing protein [Geothrix sp. 21YS21S-2]